MSRIFASKTNHAFYQTVFTAIMALAALVFLSLKAYQLSNLYLAVLIHKIKDACGCENMAQFFSMHPDIFKAVILFGVGIGIFVFYSLYKLIRLDLRTKKYIAHYLFFAVSGHSEKLRAAMKDLNINEARVVEINKPDLIVFCFGYLKPRICISRALIDLLDKDELKVVLAHEIQHVISYEPVKIFFVKYFKSIFFFLPGLGVSANKYFTFSELAADENASGNTADKSSLASAILKISEQEEAMRTERGSSLSFFSPVIEDRVNRLSDESYAPKFKLLDRGLIAGSLGLAIASLLFIFVFSSSTKAFEMHNIAGCVSSAGISLKNEQTCVLDNQPNISEQNKSIIGSIASDNFEQNSTCKAE